MFGSAKSVGDNPWVAELSSWQQHRPEERRSADGAGNRRTADSACPETPHRLLISSSSSLSLLARPVSLRYELSSFSSPLPTPPPSLPHHAFLLPTVCRLPVSSISVAVMAGRAPASTNQSLSARSGLPIRGRVGPSIV